MTCCSGRRAALNRGAGLRSVPARAIAGAAPGVAPATVALTYRGPVPIVLPSLAGAAPYRLRESGQALEVHAGDVSALLLTGWFSRA